MHHDIKHTLKTRRLVQEAGTHAVVGTDIARPRAYFTEFNVKTPRRRTRGTAGSNALGDVAFLSKTEGLSDALALDQPNSDVLGEYNSVTTATGALIRGSQVEK